MGDMKKLPFKTVKDFVDHVGRANFEARLGHKTQVVSRAITEDVMPAHWYFECRDWCRDELGIQVPENLFRRAHSPRSADAKRNASAA